MIEINFTIIIELLLFLIFFVISKRFVWGPLLQTIRERENYFNNKEKVIEKLRSESITIKDNYLKEKESIQKRIEKEIDDLIKTAYQRQRLLIELEQKQANDELYNYRIYLRNKLCLREEELQPYVEDIAQEIYKCIIQRKRLL